MATKTTGPKKRVKIGATTYSHRSCSTTKAAATKAAAGIRTKEGRTARVVSTGGAYCVYVGAKRKKPSISGAKKKK